MARYINPFSDWSFKRIFGQEYSKDLLIEFLNQLLLGEQHITDVKFKDKEMLPETKDQRGIIYDVFCETDTGEHIIVEMQNRSQSYFIDRSLYYASKTIVDQGIKGQWDYHLTPVYVICFMNFDVDENTPKKFRTDVVLADKDSGEVYSNKIRFIYLVMPLFKKKEEECTTFLDCWIYNLKHMETLEQMPFEAQHKIFKRLAEIADSKTLTKEEQEKVNTRQAERKLRILINANYGYGDYHLVLDYIRRKGEPDRTPEQMRQDIDVFLRECRKEYRKAGLEFKYIHVMEIGKKGARHHHLVVNKIDTEILQRCWYKAYEGHNRVKVFPLDDSGNYAELASYLIKYTGTHKKGTDGALQGKRWNCSKNLVRPEPEYHIISDREYFKKEPKAIKGYYVDKNSVSMGVHSPEYYGYGYLRYTLVKITDRGG